MGAQRIVIAVATLAALTLLFLLPRAFDRPANRPVETIELRQEPTATPERDAPKSREPRRRRRRSAARPPRRPRAPVRRASGSGASAPRSRSASR